MKRRGILEKEKKSRGLGCFLIALLLAGFIVSMWLFGQGALDSIIHP